MIRENRIDNGLPPLPCDSKLICELKGYEDCKGYAIDIHGYVWTCKEHNFKINLYKTFWRKLTLKNNKHGYPYIIMTCAKRKASIKVHKLVASAFIPNKGNLPIINHKDCNKTNNSVSNLEWCTYKYNSNHALLNNTRNTAKGERLPNSILTKDDIIQIFSLRKEGYTHQMIASNFCVDTSCITRILNRQSWKHIIVPS